MVFEIVGIILCVGIATYLIYIEHKSLKEEKEKNDNTKEP